MIERTKRIRIYADVPIFVNICASRRLHILCTLLYSGYHFVINIPAHVSVGIVIHAWSQQRSGGKIRAIARNHCQTSRRNESRICSAVVKRWKSYALRLRESAADSRESRQVGPMTQTLRNLSEDRVGKGQRPMENSNDARTHRRARHISVGHVIQRRSIRSVQRMSRASRETRPTRKIVLKGH